MSAIIQTQSNHYLPATPLLTSSYLPPQYSSVVQEVVKNGNQLDEQIQHTMSYQSLQAVTSDTALVNTDNLSQLININPQLLPNATTQITQAMVYSSNGVVTQNGTASMTQAFMTSQEQAPTAFYVQVENGNYQV